MRPPTRKPGAQRRRVGRALIIVLTGVVVMLDAWFLLSLDVLQPVLSQRRRTSRVIEITTRKVKQHDTSKLERLKEFTVQYYEKDITAPPGKDHYALLHYLTDTYGDGDTAVVDIGTRYAASALALAASGTPVRTFDQPTSRERIEAFRGRSEEEWLSLVKERQVNIEFYNFNLLKMTDMAFKTFVSTWLIVLDTHHLPDSSPFERELVNRLIRVGYKGLLLLDDIHLNDEMKKWWQELKDRAVTHGYVVYDVTSVGRATGTGLIDFGARAKVSLE